MADTLVLCYHAVSERWPADLSVTPQAFEQQLGWLERRGYRGVTFTDAVQQPARGKRVAVTFDDAFSSVLELGKPRLDARGWPATVFAVTSFAHDGERLRWPGVAHWADSEHAAELESLDWTQLRGLAGAGWEIGAHTVTHPKLTQIDDAALERELSDSKSALEAALDRPCPSLAYPYGDVDQRVVDAAARAGYTTAAALPARWHEPRALEYPRVGIYHPDTPRRFRVKAHTLTRKGRSLLRR